MRNWYSQVFVPERMGGNGWSIVYGYGETTEQAFAEGFHFSDLQTHLEDIERAEAEGKTQWEAVQELVDQLNGRSEIIRITVPRRVFQNSILTGEIHEAIKGANPFSTVQISVSQDS